MSSVGDRIRRQRLSMGLTQGQLARRIGISRSYMGLLETGDRRLNEPLVEGLCRELGMRPASLLDAGEADSWREGFEAGRASLQAAIEKLFPDQQHHSTEEEPDTKGETR